MVQRMGRSCSWLGALKLELAQADYSIDMSTRCAVSVSAAVPLTDLLRQLGHEHCPDRTGAGSGPGGPVCCRPVEAVS
jgi:hypothetical protein